MPRKTKTKPAPVPQSEPESAVVNGPPGEVLTLAEAAAYLRFSEAEVLRLVDLERAGCRLMSVGVPCSGSILTAPGRSSDA